MTATPHQAERRCACGCVLRAGHEGGRCECCERRESLARLAYRPEHDVALRARILAVLQAHKGERISLYRELGVWPCGLAEWVAVKAHVRYLRSGRSSRREGHTIYGFHDGTYLYEAGPGSGSASRRV